MEDKPNELRQIPISSYGIILYTWVHDQPYFLLAQRRDTIAYVDFLRGNYNPEYLGSHLSAMTGEERRRIIDHNFKELWDDLWVNRGSLYRQEFCKARKIFLSIRRDLPNLVRRHPSDLREPPWGFPKGKRQTHEADLHCAVREFEEESGMSAQSISLINTRPFVEIFQGSNSKLYKTVYYAATCDQTLPIVPRETRSKIRRYTISEEMGQLKWCCLLEAKERLNDMRQDLLNKLYLRIIRDRW